MRILYVLPSLLTGGAESLVTQWAAGLHRAGRPVEVCTLYAGGPFARRLAEQGVPVHNLNHDPRIEQYRLRRKYDPRLLAALARTVREGDYHIVHGHLFPPLLYLALVSFACPRPVYLYTEHSVQNRRRGSPLMKTLDRALYSRFRQILPVSEGVKAALCRWLPELNGKVRVVPNTVVPPQVETGAADNAALRVELGIGAEEFVVLYAGRLVRDKGPDVLLEAVRRYAGDAPAPLHALFAGEGPLKAGLAERSRGLPPNIRAAFLGNREDVPRLLALADLVVLPSRWEGLPMFLLEAMAAEKAILAAAVGGIPEAVQHEVSGWLVPPEDPAALAGALAHLARRADLREKLGKNARKAFDARYAPQAAFEALLRVYSEALEKGQTTAAAYGN